MSEESRISALQQTFASATTDDARRSAAAAAGALLERVEGDVFSTAEEVRAALVGRCDAAFLAAVTAATPAMAAAALRGRLLDGVAGHVALDGDGATLEKLCANAERVPADAALAKAAAACLEAEARASGDGRVRDGAGFEAAAALGPLLAVGPIPPWDAFARPGPRVVDPVGPGAPKHPSLRYFRHLAGFPASHGYESQALFLRQRHRRALDAAVKIVEKALKSKQARPGVLAWLARALALGAPLGQTRVRNDKCFHPPEAPSPAFGLNVAALALRLAAPLWEKGLGAKVDWRYALRDERVAFSASEPLFQGDGAAQTADDDSDDDDMADDAEERRLMKQAMEMSLKPVCALGFFPTGDADPNFSFITEIFFLAQKAVSAYLLPLWSEFGHQQRFLADLAGRLAPETVELRARIHADGWCCALEDPRLLEDAAAFASFSVDWLLAQLAAPDARDRAARLPAAFVKDACDLWTTLARCAERSGAAAARAGAAPHFGAAEAGRAVLACCELMRHELVESPLVHAKMVDFVSELLRSGARHRRGARFGGGGGLSGAVLDSERVRRALPAALAHLYTAVSAVVGLDVDADDAFDKFSVRRRLNGLLLMFWRYPLREPRAALLEFLGDARRGGDLGLAFLDTVVYCGEDALGRLADGKTREVDGKPPAERSRARGFWEGQRRACRGFLPIAESTLELMADLCLEPAARDALLKGPAALARCAAFGAVVWKRVGTEAGLQEVGVADPQDWGFDPARLLERTAALLDHARRAHGDAAWAAACAADAGFDASALEEACAAPGGGALAATRDAIKQRGAADAVDARPAVADALSKVGAVSAEAYAAALAGCEIEVVESLGDHVFAGRSGAPNARALQKELKKLRRDLPAPHADGAVFVRFDEARLDLCRCGVTGPAGTPYAGGLFVFDVWFPPTYPAVPPLVAIVTTGKGTVRFNPNLYADGKVCLSLLGTWHAADASEKWTPETGSLRQVLLSIQHQILVAEPYFNEPGRDAARGTKEGAAAAAAHNAYLRAATLQHAVADHLAAPPAGLEEVAALHLKHAAPALLARSADELKTADPAKHRALHRAAAALAAHVAQDEPPPKRAKNGD